MPLIHEILSRQQKHELFVALIMRKLLPHYRMVSVHHVFYPEFQEEIYAVHIHNDKDNQKYVGRSFAIDMENPVCLFEMDCWPDKLLREFNKHFK